MTHRFQSTLRNSSRGYAAVSLLLLLAAGIALLSLSKTELRGRHDAIDTAAAQEPLYLPEARYVKLVTLGFDGFISDILWFNTVNYFGKQYLGNKDYRWLYSMCNLVTELDPNALHVFEFCGSLLSWVAKHPEKSNAILTKAIKEHPLNWRFYYLRGFNYWYFMEDLERAKEDIARASRVKGAPTFLASLASRLVAVTENPDTAVNFLKDLIDNTKDETVQKALGEKLKLAYVSRDAERIQALTRKYEADTGQKPQTLNDLVTGGLLRFVPKDPYGEPYEFDPETGHVSSKHGKRGLSFDGKTARTGLLKNEFEE